MREFLSVTEKELHEELAAERKRRSRTEERLRQVSTELKLTENLLQLMQDLRKAERENHELRMQRRYHRHMDKIRRLRTTRDEARMQCAALADAADKARRERDELGQLLERVRRAAPDAVDTASGKEPEPMPVPEVVVSLDERRDQ